ncbi:DUF1403 family protein [Mesorhizobium cantuariense]|uniref:DUF1403 family protein n=1 Tax=Mesorhizobium cantuariense TaxID=1300275 RepID=A0ABV7MHM3_9HYPH
MRLLGRNEDEKALRDAVLLSAAGDVPGLTGKVFSAYKGSRAENPAFPRKTSPNSPPAGPRLGRPAGGCRGQCRRRIAVGPVDTLRRGGPCGGDPGRPPRRSLGRSLSV